MEKGRSSCLLQMEHGCGELLQAPSPPATSPGFFFPPPPRWRAEIFILGFFFSETDPLPQGELWPFIPPKSHRIPLMPGASKGRSPGWWEGALEGAALHHAGQGCKPPAAPTPCQTSFPPGGVQAPMFLCRHHGSRVAMEGKAPLWFSHTLVLVG